MKRGRPKTKDTRLRERIVFDTTSAIKRAIRTRAGLDDTSGHAVVNAALECYLAAEIAQITQRLEEKDSTS